MIGQKKGKQHSSPEHKSRAGFYARALHPKKLTGRETKIHKNAKNYPVFNLTQQYMEKPSLMILSDNFTQLCKITMLGRSTFSMDHSLITAHCNK